MGMFSAKSGTMGFSSPTDKRWDIVWRTKFLVMTGDADEQCQKKLQELKEKIGEEPPKDLEFWCMKD